MSPEYTHWDQIPKDIRKVITEELQRLSLGKARIINEGIAWLQNEGTISLKELHQLTPGQRTDARKQDSSWHVLLPLHNSSRDKPQIAPHIISTARRWRSTRIR